MSTTSALTAQQIGSSFVSKYYNTLTKESEQLFKFYKDNSTLIYGNETTEKNSGVITGLEAIGSKIKSLNYNDCKVKLSVVDSLNSLNGSVLVVVHGHLSFAGAPYKKFSQSFVLAEQVSPKGYYVLNDVFRFVTSEDIPAPSKKTKSVASSSPTPQSQPAATTQKSVTIAAAHSPSNDNLSESGSSEVDSTAATAGTTTSSVVGPEDSMMSDSETTETSQAKQKNPKPTTPPSVSSKTQEPVSEQPKKPAAQSPQQPQPTQAQPQPQSAPAKSHHAEKKKFEPKSYAAAVGGSEYVAAHTPSSPTPKEEGDKQQKPQRPPFKRGIPLHVSKVKPETTGKDLSEAFLKFGPIVHISNKSKENFAVIFFENAASVDQAVASNGSITVAGVPVEVEKREKFNRNRDRANGGERPLRGRGGFRGKGERGSKFGGRGRGRGQSSQAPAQTQTKPTTA